MLVLARDHAAAGRRVRVWEGAVLLAAVTTLGVIAVSIDEPVTYLAQPLDASEQSKGAGSKLIRYQGGCRRPPFPDGP